MSSLVHGIQVAVASENAWLLRLSLVIMAAAVVVPVMLFGGSPAAAQQAVPDKPEGLTGKLLDYLVVGLDWDDAEGATSYQAQYWDTTGDSPAWAEAAEAEYDGSSAVISGLPDQRYYYFQVRAVNDAGASEWSDFVLLAGPDTPTDPSTPTPEPTPEPTAEPTPQPTPTAAPAPAPVVAIDLSPSGSVEQGTATTVTMSFGGLESDADTSDTDYIFRADVVDADGCEGDGLGVDRYMWQVDEDPEVRTGSVSADCPAGNYTVQASISSPDSVELASARASFTVPSPTPEPTPEPTPKPGICDRTHQVREAIESNVFRNLMNSRGSRPGCQDITDAQLARIKFLYLPSVGHLKIGDLAGLTGVKYLHMDNAGGSLPPGVFDELGSLEQLELDDNGLSSLPPGIFDELGSLRWLHLDNNRLSSLPPGIFDELGSLRRLHLKNNGLSSLPPGIFDELGGLEELYLKYNRLSSLPPGVFDGLGRLRVLNLRNNRLSSLPPGVFDELGSLVWLYLSNNGLSSLPPGIFDELGGLEELYLENNGLSSLPPGIFDELGSLRYLELSSNQLRSLPPRLLSRHVEWPTDYFGNVSLGLVYMVTVYMVGNRLTELPDALFEVENLRLGILHLQDNPGSPFTFSMEAEAISQSVDDAGIHTARVRYKVAQGAPAMITAALEVSGGAASTASVTIDAGSVSSDEIVVTQSEAGQPVTLTLQKVSPHIPSPFAPGSILNTWPRFDYIGFFGVRFAAGAPLTLFADSSLPPVEPGEPKGICGRTPQVRDAILGKLPGISDCAAVTDADLSGVTGRLDLNVQETGEEMTALKPGDFAGLTNLQILYLTDNSLETLPEDIFEGLAALTTLQLENNGLKELPEDIFDGLGSLTGLRLQNNKLSTLPEDVFDGLTSLTGLFLTQNELSELHGDVFEGLTGLKTLYLDGNELSELPEEVFDGLTEIDELFLTQNQLSALPSGVFEGLANLRSLGLEHNDLESLPAGLFAGLTGLEKLLLGGKEAPFTLTAELERRGGGAVAVKVVEGAPFAMAVKLSADGGTLSSGTVTIEAGSVSSEEISVAPAAEGGTEVTVSVASAEFIGVDVAVDEEEEKEGYGGIQTGLGQPLTLTFSAPDSKDDQTIKGPAPTVAIALSPSGPVEPGAAIGVTMRFSGLKSDSDTGTTDYVFRADVVDAENGDADACEEPANGYGLGVERYMYQVDEDPEVRTGTISGGCPAGAYTLRASVSSADNVELASASASFSVGDPETPLSTDAALSALTLSGVDIGAFDPATTGYAAEVGHDVTETTVSATVNDDGASYMVMLEGAAGADGVIPLAVGSNVIAVEVTAEDGETTKTYTVTVTRAAAPLSNDATLSGLTLSGVDFGTFDPATTGYAADVVHGVSETTVTPTVNDDGAADAVKLDGVADADGTVGLAEGSNVIAVEVTAEDGETTKTYTVTVTRAAPALSNDATLSGLALSGVDFGAFDPATTEYAADVDNGVSETTVTPTLNDDGAAYAVKLDGVADSGGTVSLAEGSNVITVEVTAEDGETAKTYTVTVTRAAPPPSNDATLSSLTLSGAPFAFDPAIESYEVSVGHEVEQTTITAETNNEAASYEVALVLAGSYEDGTVGLAVGANNIVLVVKAADGETMKSYTVTVTRAEA